jgi:hypothetical protein
MLIEVTYLQIAAVNDVWLDEAEIRGLNSLFGQQGAGGAA